MGQFNVRPRALTVPGTAASWAPLLLSCCNEVTRAVGSVYPQKHCDCLEVGIWSVRGPRGCSCMGDQSRWIKALITEITGLQLHLLRNRFPSHCILQETWRRDSEVYWKMQNGCRKRPI